MLTLVVTPPDPILDAPTIRTRLGITDTSGDANLEAYIAAATQVLDAPDGWLGRALGQQTLQLQAAHFPELWRDRNFADPYYSGDAAYHFALLHQSFKLPFPPLRSVTSVTYLDVSGVRQTLDPSNYVVTGRVLAPAYNTTWPDCLVQPASVQITYVAGYAAGAVPAPILQAIVLSVAKMQSMGRSDIGLKQKSVIGIGMRQYETQADFGSIYDKAAAGLLSSYRVIDSQ